MSAASTIVTLVSLLLASTAMAQTPDTVDFERDVQPLFRQNCIGCHGPDQQAGGYRLDRKSVALREDFGPITPTNASASVLYLRLIGSEFGPSMPPSGPLASGDIEVIRAWIDQGADWPDHLANEKDLPPPDPAAVAMTEALRVGERDAFLEMAVRDPELLNARGPAGSTPFMYAVLYGDAEMLERLLELGADPNARNDVNATALMWAATNLDKTRILIDAGADVNARSDDARTPLFAATVRNGAGPVVELLIENGAEVDPANRSAADSTPLLEAAKAADAQVMRLLLDGGAETSVVGGRALAAAFITDCTECIDLIAENLSPNAFTEALFITAPNGDADAVRFMLDRGADVHARDSFGRTPLMYATASDLLPLEAIRLLVERGSDVNATSQRGSETPLGIARMRGDTAIVDLLVGAGAEAPSVMAPSFPPRRDNTIESAVGKSIPLLQRADVSFSERTGCVSCHNNSLPAMAVSHARSNGFAIDEKMAERQVEENVRLLAASREKFRQGIAVVDLADPIIFGYVLVGLAGEGHEPDVNTDTMAMYILNHQMPDGHWAIGPGSNRPPLSTGDIAQTALAMRSLQLYAPNVDRSGYAEAIDRAARWLARAESRTNVDRTWRLLGLAWADRDQTAINQAVSEVLALQREDGGWSDIASLESGPFTTGRALVALHAAGVPVSNPGYERGVQFLLNTQLEDGSWFVQTRALGFQPYFDNGFPHGLSQWISGAATSWATMALSLASERGAGEE